MTFYPVVDHRQDQEIRRCPTVSGAGTGMMSSDKRCIVTFERAPLIAINIEIALELLAQIRQSATRPIVALED